MAEKYRPWIIVCFFFGVFLLLPRETLQQTEPSNIRVYSPFGCDDQNVIHPSNTRDKIIKVVVGTAASTFFLCALFFYLLVRRRRNINKTNSSLRPRQMMAKKDVIKSLNASIRKIIVDENGLDVLYWKKLEVDRKKGSFKRNSFKNDGGVSQAKASFKKKESIQEVHLLHENSSNSSSRSSSEYEESIPNPNLFPPTESSVYYDSKNPPLISPTSATLQLGLMNDKIPFSTTSTVPATPVSSPKLSPKSSASVHTPLPFLDTPLATKNGGSLSPSNHSVPSLTSENGGPPPPLPKPPGLQLATKNSEPWPPFNPPVTPLLSENGRPLHPLPKPPGLQPVTKNGGPLPPNPPVPRLRSKNDGPPPPPLKPLGPPGGVKKNGASQGTSSKPPPLPVTLGKGKQSASIQGSEDAGGGQAKLKPLYWDKVTANAEHSMVWDKIGSGSFRVDDDQMEALFGYVPPKRKPSESEKNPSKSTSGLPKQITLLEPRKSQNIAIILRSLTMNKEEVFKAINAGKGLSIETLEKLTKISVTQDEINKILQFSGDPSQLVDAECFLYHLCKTVSSPFIRLEAMLFKSTYESEILHVKELLQTLESACNELRSKGLFLKLLEATLKAGNRMNAGTARGDAKAFDLSSLRKLSDVKSVDGKTTLLHFVVEEVVRLEGKRCILNRNRSLNRTDSNSGSHSKEDKTREYITIGLPAIGGLSVELSNVKKSAMIDSNTFIKSFSFLAKRVSENRRFLEENQSKSDSFCKEMKRFLDMAESNMKEIREEQDRVMNLVRRTTNYYHPGASKDKSTNPLHIFTIVRDFLGMVDQACIDIARDWQKKKPSSSNTRPSAPEKQTPAGFPNLPRHFMSETLKYSNSSSDSEGY